MHDATLILFCRRPAAGRVKTRLALDLGDEAAARLYAAFVTDLFKTAGQCGAVALSGRVNVVVTYAREQGDGAAGDAEIRTALAALQADAGVHFEMQSQIDGNLGARMAQALEAALVDGKQAAGKQAAVIIGTDSPQLSREYIADALGRLTRPDAPRVILGPCADGGYVLVGVSGKVPPALFAGIPWSSPNTLAATEAALRTHGVSYELLETTFDVDTAADLPVLTAEIQRRQARGEAVPRRTADVLAAIRREAGGPL